MIRLAVALLCLALVRAPLIEAQPAIDRVVTDLPDVLSPADEGRIEAIVADHRDRTGVQIAVLLVPTTGGEPIEDLAIQAAEAWLGGGPGADAGALLVVATTDRRARLDIGFGLEGDLTDAEVRRILESVRPSLERDAFAEAVLGVVWALVDETEHRRPEPAPVAEVAVGSPTGAWLALGAVALGVGLLAAWFWRRRAARDHPASIADHSSRR